MHKFLFDYSKGKFDRDNIYVVYHRLIWQNLTTPDNRVIFLYGAYYDDRHLHNGKRFLQILAVGALTRAPLYAVMWTEQESRTNVFSICRVRKNGAGSHHGKVYYDQFFYSCKIKRDIIPKYVSLTFNYSSLQSNLLSVYVPERKRIHNFSVCVETVYNHVDPYQIVEWVEANKILGVTFFSVYPCNVSKSTMKIFRQFEAEGVMRVSYTPSPFGDDSWIKQMTSSPISFNDCMLRQMYSAEYIIPLDFDEIITPKTNAKNYKRLLKEIDKYYGFKKPLAVYVIKTAFFLTDCGMETAGDIKIIRFVKKITYYQCDKSFVNPRSCLSVFNHFCLVYFYGFNGQRNKRIDFRLAQVNHYRKSKFKKHCELFRSEGVEDVHFRDRFAKVILKAFRKKIDKFRHLNLL